MSNLWGVQKAQFDQAWPLVEKLITDAADRSALYYAHEIGNDIRDGRAQLWVAWDDNGVNACAVTYIERSERTQWLKVFICTGDGMDDWKGLLRTIEDWARSNGCRKVHTVSRPGWERVLKSDGYTKTHVLLEKKL